MKRLSNESEVDSVDPLIYACDFPTVLVRLFYANARGLLGEYQALQI
jgi:hypothetical protein